MSYKILILLMVGIFYVSDLFAVALTLASDPQDCEVSVRKLGDANKIRVGKTPLATSFEEFSNNYIDANDFVLIIEKDGYYPYEIVVSELAPTDLEMLVTLDIKQDFEQYRSVDAVVSSLFNAQALLRAKKYSEGLGILKELEETQPYLSIIVELMGSAYYMQKDLVSALDAYTKAYRVNPENRDAFTMKKFLEKSLGISAQ